MKIDDSMRIDDSMKIDESIMIQSYLILPTKCNSSTNGEDEEVLLYVDSSRNNSRRR